MGCWFFRKKKKVNYFVKASEETLVAWSFSCDHQSTVNFDGGMLSLHIPLCSYIQHATCALFFFFFINDHIHFFFAHFQSDKMLTWWLESSFVTCIIEKMHVVKVNDALTLTEDDCLSQLKAMESNFKLALVKVAKNPWFYSYLQWVWSNPILKVFQRSGGVYCFVFHYILTVCNLPTLSQTSDNTEVKSAIIFLNSL